MKILKAIIVAILTWEARLALAKYKPRIIAITGSVGKTTTKDAIYAILADAVFVRRSAKSFNSDIGVPLTILGCENAWADPLKWVSNILKGLALLLVWRRYPDWLVLEVGADRPGDIKRIAQWLRSDIVVFTGVPEIPVHVEAFSSPEEVFKEKRALIASLKAGGSLILNSDDVRARELRNDFRASAATYGLEGGNDFSASHDEIIYEAGAPVGVRFRVEHGGSSIPISVFGALGRPRVYAALAALATGEKLGLDFVAMTQSLSKWTPPPGRMRIIRGARGATIIDDTYNSSPSAAFAALDTLQDITAARRIAVLGDMLELGKWTKDAHRRVGERAAEAADMLITVGFRARAIGEAALDKGMKDEYIREYEHGESVRAGRELFLELREGDVVLVKGSQSMRMEKAVKELMDDPASAPSLLVRQEEEWKRR